MRSLLALAFATLAAASVGGCGGTLYTSEGLPALPDGTVDCAALDQLTCPNLVTSGPPCVAHTRDHCASCTDACPADPADGSYGCPESVVGARDWTCRLTCNPGWLRFGATCSRATAVAAGDAHSCAVAGGTLKCWGENGAGQVSGAPSSGSVLLPVDLASGVSLVAAGGTSTCAVVGGSVTCWGSLASPSPAVTTAAALAVGASHACALLSSGAIQCWGSGAPVTAAPGGSAFLALSSGANHACALDSAGAVTCWGDNAHQQLGVSTAATTSHQVFASGIAALGAGYDQACAADASGGGRKLLCWGNDAAPAQVTRVNFDAVEIAPGRAHVCVHKDAEGPKCFGDNALGQLGQAVVNAGELSTVPSPGAGSYALAAGRDHTCTLFPDGSAQCWGANAAGQLGGGTTGPVASGVIVTVSGR